MNSPLEIREVRLRGLHGCHRPPGTVPVEAITCNLLNPKLGRVTSGAAPSARSLLFSLEARRLADPFRHPRAGAWIGVALPAALGLAALWLGADSVRPDPRDGDGAIGLGLLIASPIAFWAYPILFRPSDDALLRRLGIPARASYGLRAARLGALTLLVVLLALVPFAATGTLGALPAAVALTAGLVGWGM